MGLFDFLKPKKKQAIDPRQDPELRHALLETELDFILKQSSNMKAVGRKKEADKEVAKFIAKTQQNSFIPSATPRDIALIAYRLSYIFVPSLVFRRWDDFLDIWNGGMSLPVYLALYGAITGRKRFTHEQIFAFKGYEEHLFGNIFAYLIAYPAPPMWPVDVDEESFFALPTEQRPILAPHFSAALHDRNNGERHLYVLGQTPVEGTTLRIVAADGSHGNCGPGPEPSIAAFLEKLKDVMQREG